MEEKTKGEKNVKKPFASLHKRIQNKYLEMQKKLEKSRSVDSLSNLSDDAYTNDLTYCSMDDLRETDEVFIDEVELETKSVKVESSPTQNAISHDVFEASFAEIEDTRSSSGDYEKCDSALDDRRTYSVDSLLDVVKESDESLRLTPPPRTIRQRFIAARERRREEKGKQQEKKKEKMEKLVLSNIKPETIATLSTSSVETRQSIRIHKKNKLATVTVALIEVTGLESLSDGKERLLLCRYKLGPEKGKTKIMKSGDSVVKWQELFNINMYDEHNMLEFTLHDNKTLLGRHILDLSGLEKDQTHILKLELKDGEAAGAMLFILLTISGLPLLNALIDTDDFEKAQKSLDLAKLQHEVVGSLSVIVYGAKGLSAQDCFCVLKLTNERLQTHTEYKTHDPNWMKIFTFHVTDITTILEITIFEEKKNEEIGKISIPLLRIHNGEKIWYALKDSTQRDRAKGNNPRILLEMRTSWNLLKASIRVINPKETDFLETKPKLDRRVFARNLSRSKAVIKWTLDALKVIKTCFEWESTKWNAIALAVWIIFCYFFKIWMLPLLFLIPFVRYRPEKYYWFSFMKTFSRKSEPKKNEIVKVQKEEKSTLRQKINSLTEMVQSVQNGIGRLASVGESVKNLVNFTVPYVSLLATFFILLIALFMYIVPLKYILICWGIHKFTRKILRPNRIPNSEILDLLSRVPDDEILLDCEELSLELEEEEKEEGTPTKTHVNNNHKN